jgi:hypothetical protein
MIMNNRMRALLEETSIQIPESLDPLRTALRRIVDSGLIENEGCFFLKALNIRTFDVKKALEKYEDKTGLECSTNNLYIQSIIYTTPCNAISDIKFVLKQGIQYAIYLSKRISMFGHFKIILSLSLDSENPGIVDCSVRFHLIRQGENWISENLEDYCDDAVLVF